MKIITKNKQRECVKRLIAIRRITSDMNYISSFDNEQENVKRWADNMEYLADNIIEIADIIGGVPAMVAIKKDLEKALYIGENERLTLKSVNGDVWLLDSEGKPYLLSVDGDDYNNALNRLAYFETIGTIEEFETLKEKNEPKKVVPRHIRKYDGFDDGECPTCGNSVLRDAFSNDVFCDDCGQKLDWE